MADRFWWRQYLTLRLVGDQHVATLVSDGTFAEYIAKQVREGCPIESPPGVQGIALREEITPTEVAACVAWQDYADDHPEMDSRQLLGLPEEPGNDFLCRLADQVSYTKRAYGNLLSVSDVVGSINDEIGEMYSAAVTGPPSKFRTALVNLAAECQRAVEQLTDAKVL